MKSWPPQDQVYWYLKRDGESACKQDITTDVAIIGGGIAGLSAAQAFRKRKKNVVLLEQYYCGSGASGKSSGFITPNAEVSFTEFSKKFGPDGANTIWNFITSGLTDIKTNITTHNFACDYKPQDTLTIATKKKDIKSLQEEYENLSNYGYPVALHSADETKTFVKAKQQYGSLVYKDTFSMNAYAYCQHLKKQLQKDGVLIFEETPATSITGHVIQTPHATIRANHIIVCTDRFTPNINLLKNEVYHAQTFVMMSQQLTDEQIKTIFPTTTFLTWDTNLIYNYFCLTAQNRLIVGGGSVLNTYNKYPTHNSHYMFNKLTDYFNTQFPQSTIQFEQMWPGLIGLSKDIMPLVGKDKDAPHIVYVAASAGLPIAAALGRYSAEHVLDGNDILQDYFSPYRSFPIQGFCQKVIGKKLSFALSNLIKMNIP